MNDDNPLLALFGTLLKDEDEKMLIVSIIENKNDEEIIQLFLKKTKK